MKLSLNLSKRQRIIIFYIIGLILPGIILGVFAFRGLRNDQALRDKQTQQELKLLSIDVFSELDKRINDIQENLQSNPSLINPLVLIGWEKLAGEQAKVIQSRMLYWPDGSLPDVFPVKKSAEIEAIQKIEFSQKDYPFAIRQYKTLLENTEDNDTKVQALLGLGRTYKKTDQFSEAINIYQTLSKNHPGELLPGGLPVKTQAMLEIIRLSVPLDASNTNKNAADELIRFVLNPSLHIEHTPYRFLLNQCKSLDLQLPDQQEIELNISIDLTTYLHNLHQMSSGLIGGNQRMKYLASEKYPGLLIQSEGQDGSALAWVLSADSLIRYEFESILSGFNAENIYQWAVLSNGITKLGSLENENPVEIAFPAGYPFWTLSLAKEELSGWDRIFKSSQGVLLLVFVFIFLLMIAGLVFMLYTLNQEMRVSKMKSQFISNVSHEFKTPLTSIRHMTEIMHLKRIDSEERKEEYLQSMLEQCDHLGHLIENILDFSKMEEDIKNYHFELHQLDEILEDLILVVKARIGDDSYAVNLIMDQAPPPILLDKDAIQQVFFNLLDNAYKYSKGSRCIDLELFVQGKGQGAKGKNLEKDLGLKGQLKEMIVVVRDYGIGISEKDLGRIFERFYRGDRLRTEGIKGSGIGLTIVNRIIQAHGGRIEVESEIDKGTTFRVYLPVNTNET